MKHRKSHNLLYSLITFFLFGCFLPIWGQVDFMDEKNKITEIKRNKAYVYGEGIAETMEEAIEIAEGSLKSEILRVISENENLQNSNVFEIGTVRQNSEKVTLKRGTLDRVFLYVAIDCIQPGKNGITINFQKEEKENTEEKATEANVVQVSEPEPERVLETEQIDIQEKNPENGLVQTEGIISIQEETISKEKNEPEEKETEINPTVLPEVTSPLLQKIIATGNMADMEKIFRMAKDQRQLMWGNVTSTINPSWNLLIYNKEGVKAILEKGTDKRLNYLTGETDNLSDYQNDPKIWFIIYE